MRTAAMPFSLGVLLLLCALHAVPSRAGLAVSDLRGNKIPSPNLLGTPDAYVKVFSGTTDLGRTATRNNNRNPWWDEDFHHFQAREGDVLKLEVYDDDILFDDLIGTCTRTIQVGTWDDM